MIGFGFWVADRGAIEWPPIGYELKRARTDCSLLLSLSERYLPTCRYMYMYMYEDMNGTNEHQSITGRPRACGVWREIISILAIMSCTLDLDLPYMYM